MRLFELVASDFWGKQPEKLVHELNQDVLEGFRVLVSDAFEYMSDNLRNGFNGKGLVSRKTIATREVLCKLEVSTQAGTAVFVFRSPRRQRDNTGAFYAYAMCAVFDSFSGYASAVMGNDMGEYVCEVALKESSAKALLLHLQLQSRKSWIDNA